jgi:hypothetical protein
MCRPMWQLKLNADTKEGKTVSCGLPFVLAFYLFQRFTKDNAEAADAFHDLFI